MDIVINLKDGSIFDINARKIKDISFDGNMIFIIHRKDNIKFEKNLLDSYKIHRGRVTEYTAGYISFVNNLISLFNIILNSS